MVAVLQPKGGSFTGDDKDFLRFKLGQGQVIPAFEEAVASMKVRETAARGCAHCRVCPLGSQLLAAAMSHRP